MSILKYFRTQKKTSANIAKERLQIIVAHEHIQRQTGNNDYVARLQKELISVIAKYVQIDEEQVTVELDRDGDRSILELNVTLPDVLPIE